MYTANLMLNDKEFKGTLDFHVLIETQKSLKRLDRNLKMYEIFSQIAEQDMEVISALILQSFIRLGYDINEIEINYNTEKEDEELIQYFIDINTFLKDLMDECMPKNKESDSEFEDIPTFNEADDWDIPEMEYLWNTILKREDFWSITPKNFFEQMEIHSKINSKDDKGKCEEL